MKHRYGPEYPRETYVQHSYPEQLVDLGEVSMNYAVTGSASAPALLLIPSQTESWWGYEAAMGLLGPDFNVFAVDLRGQGRTTRTPGRYTLDNMGNDLVRFIQLVVGRPTIVSGLSSGGVLAAWLAAYAPPGLVRAACFEDAPIFSSELDPAHGNTMRQSDFAIVMALFYKYLGDQWSIGAWDEMIAAAPSPLPDWMAALLNPAGPTQNLKEYDPEWARAFRTGTATASCDHLRMLKSVKVPVLFTHHFRIMEENGGPSHGAVSDYQARRAGELIKAAGQSFVYRSFPQMGHAMHSIDPGLYVSTLREWMAGLG